MEKVAIIMSTYNGEKYVKEQVDSLLAQTYSDIHLYIRDDGSKDKTWEILQEYKDNAKVTLVKGENKGFVKGFYSVLEMAQTEKYISFCDQDDVWNEDKIQRAVEMLEKEDNHLPLLYFSNYDYYDAEMNFKGHQNLVRKGPSFRNSLFDCITLGISIVINQKARNLLVETGSEDTCGHDWWAYMVCSGLGKVIYDDTVTLKYRRHENNVSPGGKNFIKFQIYRIKKFFIGGYFTEVKKQLKKYETLLGNKLNEQDRELLAMFTKPKYNFLVALRKVCYPKMFRQGIVDEIMLRGLFLIGKF